MPSAASVDTDLRVLRAVFNVAEEWRHVAEGRNPFAGQGQGHRRGEAEAPEGPRPEAAGKKDKHYTFEEVKAILALADEGGRRGRRRPTAGPSGGCGRWSTSWPTPAAGSARPSTWSGRTSTWTRGVAFLYFKIESDLKTEGSQAPFGLPDRLVEVLRDWKADKTCSWVFPNERKKPWKTGGTATGRSTR